jgi:hypothetical protein
MVMVGPALNKLRECPSCAKSTHTYHLHLMLAEHNNDIILIATHSVGPSTSINASNFQTIAFLQIRLKPLH